MKAIDIYNHLKEKGTWVYWKKTSDKFLFGEPNVDVHGVAVAWMASWPNLKKAAELGCNVFITHEPLYAGVANEFGVYSADGRLLEENDPWVDKGKWLEQSGIVVFRCHDVWDEFPDIGIHGAWAKWLGFNGKPRKQVMFYEVHDFPAKPFGDLTVNILDRVKPLGQDVLLTFGDPASTVSSIAVGTGAITNYRLMNGMGADVLLLTDDGTRLWESAQWAEDTGKHLIIVNHATAEEPGMRSLARYLQQQFPAVPVTAIERGCLYSTVA